MMKKPLFFFACFLIAFLTAGNCLAAISDTEQKVIGSDATAGYSFGRSVAVSGNTMIIGSSDNDMALAAGAAYIFERIQGTWIEQIKLLAPDGAAFDNFGSSVAISGDYAVIGAYTKEGIGSNSGAAYIFVRDNGTWQFQAKLVSTDNAGGDYFSKSVSISGDFVLIGSHLSDLPTRGTNCGAAYIFKRTGASWSQITKLTAFDGMPSDNFGLAVSISENYAAIGSPGDSGEYNRSGSVYIYKKDPTGWPFFQKVTGHDSDYMDNFGSSVSIQADCLVAGAYRDSGIGSDGSTLTMAGSAYVFELDGTQWIETQKLIVHDQAGYQYLTQESAASVSGNYIFLGAYGTRNSEISNGATYVFKRTESGWEEIEKIIAGDMRASALFGRAVSVSGASLVCGALRDSGTFDRGGAAYIYRLEICKGDMDENRITDGLDLALFALKYGQSHVGTGDFNNDGRIDPTDIELLAESMGSLSCNPF